MEIAVVERYIQDGLAKTSEDKSWLARYQVEAEITEEGAKGADQSWIERHRGRNPQPNDPQWSAQVSGGDTPHTTTASRRYR
jgi:hypothetical protein